MAEAGDFFPDDGIGLVSEGVDSMKSSQRWSSCLRGEKLNFKSVAKEISKSPFLAPEVQWASKFAVFVRFAFSIVSNHAHIWYSTAQK